jgi:ATP-dependent exoDNAse (exonuclease V) alpha subunit
MTQQQSTFTRRDMAMFAHRHSDGIDQFNEVMVGTRQLERVLSHAAEAGAKVVLVGDPQQLQSIEAGAAFRSIHERHGGAEIGEVRRQREDLQRDATRDLATGRTGDAIHAYDTHGMVHEAVPREQARGPSPPATASCSWLTSAALA